MSAETITYNPSADVFLLQQKPGEWSEPGFELNRQLAATTEPMLEIAGPTPRGYQTITRSILKRLVTLNIQQISTGRFHKKPGVDILGNGHNLPFADKSLGAVFVSAFLDSTYPDFETNYRAPMIDEATRVIEPSGFLVMQYGSIRDILH